jgi:hypothetical protein
MLDPVGERPARRPPLSTQCDEAGHKLMLYPNSGPGTHFPANVVPVLPRQRDLRRSSAIGEQTAVEVRT